MSRRSFPKSIDKTSIVERVNKLTNLIENPTSDLNCLEKEFEHLFCGETENGSDSIENIVYNSVEKRYDKKSKSDSNRLEKNTKITNENRYLEFKTTKILVDLSSKLELFIEKNKSKISEDSIFIKAFNKLNTICSEYLLKLENYRKKDNEPSNSNTVSQSTNEPFNSNTVSQSISSMSEVTESSAKNPFFEEKPLSDQNKNNGLCCDPKVTGVPCPHYPE